MARNLQKAVPLAATLMLASCEKELDFTYHDIEPVPVIEASLTQEGARAVITMTTPMDEPMDRLRLTDATVTLTDLDDGTDTRLLPDDDGAYVSMQGGVSGHRYRLTVERGGAVNAAESLMYEPTEIISLEFNWVKMPYDHVAVLQVSFRDISPEPGDSYWVRVYRNGETYMWAPVSDSGARDDGTINEVFMTTRMDLEQEDDATALHDGDLISVTVAPVSRDFADYLQAIASDSNGPRMFSGPLCLGYFLAAPLASSRIVFHPDQIPYF